jgi:hypothetical protein
MRTVQVGDQSYRIVAHASGADWTAHAERVDTGERFGVDCTGGTEAEASEWLVRWLVWQAEHAAALEALQQAERAYHRTIAGGAFANPLEGPTSLEIQKESLDELEAVRRRLDEIRNRRP